MLKRILEPEVMDTRRDAVEYDQMDFLDANTKFATDALRLLDARPSPTVLDVGTANAQIPILMRERNPSLQIVAIDLAVEMLRIAGEAVARAGFTSSIRLERQDAKALRFPDRSFDMVICNSTVHHIADPTAIFREIARVIKPDGAIMVRDLIRPLSSEEAWATVKRVAAGDHPHQQQLFHDSLCAGLTVEEVEQFVRKAGLWPMHVGRASDRHWTAERRAGPPRGGPK